MAGRFALRAVSALDLDLAARLHGDSFAPLGERGWTRQDMAELLASPGVAGLLLELGGREIGLVLWRIAANEAELLTIAVQADHRRGGAGRMLLEAVIERAAAGGAHELFLEVGADNSAALALYDHLGFRTVGRRAAYYRRGEAAAADAIVMRRAVGLWTARGG